MNPKVQLLLEVAFALVLVFIYYSLEDLRMRRQALKIDVNNDSCQMWDPTPFRIGPLYVRDY